MYTNYQTNLSVDSWPPKRKDVQLLFRSCMSFSSGGQLSTDKLVWQFVYNFLVAFPVLAGIKIKSSPTRKWKKKNLAQTENGTIKMYTNCKIDLSVYCWPPKRKDVQLLISPQLVWWFVYNFLVSFPVWAGIKINSSPNRK